MVGRSVDEKYPKLPVEITNKKIDLEKILKKIVNAKIGIIGDFCLDVY